MTRIGNFWMNSAFEAIVIGEKLTTRAGNTMEIINFLDPIFDSSVHRYNSQGDRPPSTKETEGYQVGAN